MYRFVVFKFSLGHTTVCPLSRCSDPEKNEEEREGSTLIVFAEISSFPYGSSRDSLRVGTIRAEWQRGCPRRLPAANFRFLRQMPSVPTGRLLRLVRQSSLPVRTFSTSKCRLEVIHKADEAVCQGRTSPFFAALILMSCTVQTLVRATTATRTNGRVALVDFYTKYVFGSYDAIKNDVIDGSCTQLVPPL